MKKFRHTLFVGLLGSLFLLACNSENKKETQVKDTSIQKLKEPENLNLVRKPDSWITERVNKAKEKLYSSEAGRIIWESMVAHGGLTNWFKQGALTFQFDYVPTNGGKPRKTFQYIDTWSNKAHHELIDGTNNKFGWDGKNAWKLMEDPSQELPVNPRFWALTPYYFFGQPFLFDGEGVDLERLDDKILNDKEYEVVKITFSEGTGDAPNDYYINYFDRETHYLMAIRYIVSYPAFFKDGGHSPEKIMIVDDVQEVGEITLATTYRTFMIDPETEELGELVTNIEVLEPYFNDTIKNEFFEIPEGAQIVESM